MACTAEMPNKRDFGRCVEAQAEQEPDRKHVPALGDEAEQRTEETREESAIVEQEVEILLDERFATLHRLKGAVDRHQNNDVEDCDGEQEQRRDAGADDSANLLHRIESRRKRRRGEGDADRHEHHDGRMAERKEKSNADWALPLLHKLSGDVVDRRDMIGIDRVAQTERKGQ